MRKINFGTSDSWTDENLGRNPNKVNVRSFHEFICFCVNEYSKQHFDIDEEREVIIEPDAMKYTIHVNDITELFVTTYESWAPVTFVMLYGCDGHGMVVQKAIPFDPLELGKDEALTLEQVKNIIRDTWVV
jgi:hypothetical protein